jgi:dihydrofolate reductase
MAKLIYGLNQSIDGYVDHMKIGPPGPDVFRYHLEQVLASTGLIYGARTYSIMEYWDEAKPGWEAMEHEFAAAWRSRPKWVMSRSLKSVGLNATLFADDAVTAVRKLKAEHTGEIHVAGPDLAQSLTAAGLIDEYHVYIRPVVLNSGKPFFTGPVPPLRLIASDLIGDNTVRLTYTPA